VSHLLTWKGDFSTEPAILNTPERVGSGTTWQRNYHGIVLTLQQLNRH